MATVDSVLLDARYDLRAVNSDASKDESNYIDEELLSYANRSLIQLENVLSALKSDWVYSEDATVTLSAAANYASAPSSCIVVHSVWNGTTEIPKKDAMYVYRARKFISGTGGPSIFANSGTNIIFDRTADAEYTLTVYYDVRQTALATGANMPFNDEFNGMIREGIILFAHKRNENNVDPDTVVYNFYMKRLIGNVIRRNHIPKRRKIDF